jgi:hypothetical protein
MSKSSSLEYSYELTVPDLCYCWDASDLLIVYGMRISSIGSNTEIKLIGWQYITCFWYSAIMKVLLLLLFLLLIVVVLSFNSGSHDC